MKSKKHVHKTGRYPQQLSVFKKGMLLLFAAKIVEN